MDDSFRGRGSRESMRGARSEQIGARLEIGGRPEQPLASAEMTSASRTHEEQKLSTHTRTHTPGYFLNSCRCCCCCCC